MKLTIRARLTLVYGGLFLAAGLLMLGVTYALMSQQEPKPQTNVTSSVGQPTVSPDPGSSVEPPGAAGQLVSTVSQNTWNDALGALLTQGGIALAAVAATSIGLGWLLAGRMLQPLHRVTDTARRIADAPAADRGLHERIALDGPHDEVKELADTFDVMLARLDHAFDGQRRFIANASHELRTPLTVNRSLLEVALFRADPTPEVRQLGHTLLEVNARHERLLDGLLLLARSDQEVTEGSYVDMADIVEHVTSQTDAGTLTVRTVANEAPTNGNPALLERLVQNLVDNAIRYNIPENGWVRVASGLLSDGSVVVEVSNTGPVVPRYDIPGLFEPFRRLGTDRVSAPGAGLGLSIVRAVARAHGGAVRAEPRSGGGLVVAATLPGAGRTWGRRTDGTVR
jgi:signal transduction histidine kinase